MRRAESLGERSEQDDDQRVGDNALVLQCPFEQRAGIECATGIADAKATAWEVVAHWLQGNELC